MLEALVGLLEDAGHIVNSALPHPAPGIIEVEVIEDNQTTGKTSHYYLGVEASPEAVEAFLRSH